MTIVWEGRSAVAVVRLDDGQTDGAKSALEHHSACDFVNIRDCVFTAAALEGGKARENHRNGASQNW